MTLWLFISACQFVSKRRTAPPESSANPPAQAGASAAQALRRILHEAEVRCPQATSFERVARTGAICQSLFIDKKRPLAPNARH